METKKEHKPGSVNVKEIKEAVSEIELYTSINATWQTKKYFFTIFFYQPHDPLIITPLLYCPYQMDTWIELYFITMDA